jgi:hypothetical protein
VGLVGDEMDNKWAQKAALKGSIFDRPLSWSDLEILLVKPPLMRASQAKWDSADTGRFAHSILWYFGSSLKAKMRTEVLFALCRGFYLNIALLDCILVDFELLKIWCVCVCRWLWDSGPLNVALWKIPVEEVMCREVLHGPSLEGLG